MNGLIVKYILVKRIRIINYLRSQIYRLRKKIWPKLVILCYHRVNNYKADPVNITVSKKNFKKQIEILKTHAQIIHPNELFDRLENRKDFPKRSVLLTFDDGYSSYQSTMQTLLDNSISAIFFITTTEIKFWWDILSTRLLEPKTISDSDYKIFGEIINMLGKDFRIEKKIDEESQIKVLKWKITDNTILLNRLKAFQLIVEELKKNNYSLKNKIISIINDMSHNRRNFSYLSNKKFTSYHTIGAHCINHYDLSKLSYEDQKNEIEGSKAKLESIIDGKVDTFAYPFGMRYNYNNNSINLVKNNYKYGFSNFEGLVHKDSNIFELPRFLVRDWTDTEFKYKINKFFDN